MKKILSLLVAYFVLVGQAFAVTGVPDNLHWEAAGFGGAGRFSMIVPDHFVADKIYAVPDVNAPYVSTDKGENWNYLSTAGGPQTNFQISQTASFVQSKNNPLLMYAMESYIYGGLSKSTDGGQTWTKVANYRGVKGRKQIAIDPDDDNIVYVVSISTSGGSQGGSVYRTTDGGQTWSTYVSLPFNSRVSSYTTSSTCSAAGGSWSTALGKCIVGLTFVYVDEATNDLLIGSLKFGMVRYDMDTDTQQYIDLTGTNALYNGTYDTYIDGSSVENFCVSAGHKIACTANFTDWTYTSALTSSSTFYISSFAVRRKADTSLSFVAHRRLITSQYTTAQSYSTDSGTTWNTFSITRNGTINPTIVFGAGSANISYLSSDPNDEDVFYLASDWILARSDDGGATFYEKDYGAQNTVVMDVTIAPNGRIFQTMMDAGVQYSDDYGANWVQGTPYTSKGQPFVTNSVNDYGGHYWRVETAGTFEEWEAGQGKVFVCATMYSTPPSIYAVNFLLRSVDGGDTWARSNSGLPTAPLAGDAVWQGALQGGWGGFCRSMALSADETKLYIGMDGQNGSASTTGGLFLSEDDGLTFTRQWPSTPNRIYHALAVDPTDPTGETLLFGTFRYNLYRVTGQTESAELNGSGQTRTGTLDKGTQYIMPGTVTFTSSGGEIFTDNGSGILTSNLGGSGTVGYWGGAYSLTFVSEPSTTTVNYNWRGYVGDSNGPGDYIVSVAYDSQGTPYALSQTGGARIYKSVVTTYGDGSGQWGTWRLMKSFGSAGLPEGLIIDKNNDKRIFVSVSEGQPTNRRIWVTPNADKNENATWYDITGDLGAVGGCRNIDINYFEGTSGYLYCASNGGGVWKLNLQDSPSATPGRTCIGGCNE